MTKLFEQAVEAARQLTPEEQDELALLIMQIVGGDDIYELSEEDEAAIDVGLAELEQGNFLTMQELRETLAKYRP